MLTRILRILLVVATFLCIPLLHGCDVVDLDATTYDPPTPNVWGETMAAELEQVTEARQTREAGR